MTLDERQLAVFLLLSLVLGIRVVAHRMAGGMFRNQDDGLAREGGKAVGVLLRLVFLVGGLGGTIAWLVDPGLLPGALPVPSVLAWPAVLAAELGIVLLVWVHVCLGLQFSGTLHLREGHELVRHGPYARLRHPMYSSFLLLLGGLSVLMGNLILAAVLLGSQVWVLLWRLPAEEAALAQRFGPEWAQYRAQTSAVIPGIW